MDYQDPQTQLLGLQAINNPTRIAAPVAGTTPSPIIPRSISEPTTQFSNAIDSSKFLQGANSNLDAMTQELFNFDKQMETNYSPFPQVPGYVDNPADAIRAQGAYARGVGGNIGITGQAIDQTTEAYNRATSALLDKFLDFYKMRQEEEQARQQEEQTRKMEQFKLDLEIAKLTGRSVTNPFTGEKIDIPLGAGTNDQITLDQAAKFGLPVGTTLSSLSGKMLGQDSGPVQLSGAIATDQAKLASMYVNAKRLAENFQPGAVGLWQGLAGTAASAFNLADPANAAFRKNLGILSNIVRNYISGSQVSTGEERFLKQNIPTAIDSDQDVQQKLATLQQWALDKTSGNLGASGYGSVDPAQYLSENYQAPTLATPTTNPGPIGNFLSSLLGKQQPVSAATTPTVPAGKILVRRKADGVVGTIDNAAEFNPSVYEYYQQ